MNILNITKQEIYVVETDNEDYSGIFTRYSEDCWYQQIGESDEPFY